MIWVVISIVIPKEEIQEKSQTNSLEEAFIYFGDINENIKVGDK